MTLVAGQAMRLGRRLDRRTALAAGLVAMAAAGCRDQREPSADPGRAAIAAWVPACEAALKEAAAVPPRERARTVLAGCRSCGASWDALIAAERGDVRPADILSVVDACGGTCRGTARTNLADALAEVARGDAPSLPWRQLARDCPATVGVDETSARHASAIWYALGKVAAGIAAAAQGGKAPPTLAASAMGLVVPLPARSVAGTGFRLATARSIDPRLARLHVTVTSTETTVGALPLARLGAKGIELVPVPGAPYPGEPVALDGLIARLDALGRELTPAIGDLDGPLLIAPLGLPASRVLEVLRAAGDRRIYLAAFAAPAPAADKHDAARVGWVDVATAVSAPFGGRVPGRTLAVRLGQGGAIGVGGGWGGLATATALPPGPAPETLRAADAAVRIAGGDVVVAIDVTDEVTVEDLTRLVDALAGAHITAVVAAPALRWPARLPAFDEGALRAAHVAPGPPPGPAKPGP